MATPHKYTLSPREEDVLRLRREGRTTSAIAGLLGIAEQTVKDPDKPMDLDRARVISEVAQTIINTAKVEVDLVKAVGGSTPGGAFFNLPEESRSLPRIASPDERKAAHARRSRKAETHMNHTHHDHQASGRLPCRTG
jgi:hypothetical protein